jgi:hypothetical protein
MNTVEFYFIHDTNNHEDYLFKYHSYTVLFLDLVRDCYHFHEVNERQPGESVNSTFNAKQLEAEIQLIAI